MLGGGGKLPEELCRVVAFMIFFDGVLGDCVCPKEELLPLRRAGTPGGRGNDDILTTVFESFVIPPHNLFGLYD